jgi:hypothetical protein
MSRSRLPMYETPPPTLKQFDFVGNFKVARMGGACVYSSLQIALNVFYVKTCLFRNFTISQKVFVVFRELPVSRRGLELTRIES